MNEIDRIFAQAAKENIEAEQKSPAPTKDEIARTAKFLKRWAKGKSITRQQDSSTFWGKGSLMTKITFKMAQGLADAGLATLTGDPRKAGAQLRMK